MDSSKASQAKRLRHVLKCKCIFVSWSHASAVPACKWLCQCRKLSWQLEFVYSWIKVHIALYIHIYIYIYIYIYILYSNQVVPGQAGGGSFKFETLKRFSPIERYKDCGYKWQASVLCFAQQSLDLSFRCHVFWLLIFLISSDLIASQLFLEIDHCMPLSLQSVSSQVISVHLMSSQLFSPHLILSHLMSSLPLSALLSWSQLLSSLLMSPELFSSLLISGYLSFSQIFRALLNSSQLSAAPVSSSYVSSSLLSSSHIF